MSADLVGTVGVDIDVLHAVHTRTERAVADPGLELHDRVAHERTFAPSTPPRVTESAPGDLAAVLRDQVAAARAVHLMFTGALRAWTPGTGLPARVRLLTHDVRRYDGAPFTGRPPGEVGPHGALSSVEALVVDDDALDAAYGGRTRPRHDHARADPVDLQRDRPPVHQPAKPRQKWHPSPAALVTMATTPGPRPCQPLPPTRSHAAMITIYGCSTSVGVYQFQRRKALEMRSWLSFGRGHVRGA